MLPINKTYLSNNCSYDYNNPQYVVVHYTGVKNKHLAGTIAKNIYEGIVEGSAHYSVDDTSIYQAVPDNRGAWAVGDDNGYGVFPFGITNQNSISIEMASSGNYIISQKTRENTAELVAYLLKKYGLGIDRVKRHHDCSGKDCPSGWCSAVPEYDRYAKGQRGDQEFIEFKAMVQKVLNGESLNNTTKPKVVDYKGEDCMFNSDWYLNRYVDVAKNPNYINNAYKHYVDYGKKEHRLPIPRIPSNFVEKDYVELNGFQNIVGNGKQFSSGTEHFLMYGWKEQQRKLFKGQPDTLPKGTEVKVLRGAKWGKGAGNPAKAGTELGNEWLYNINTCSVYVNDYKVNNGQAEYQLTLHKDGKMSGVIWLWTGYVFVISDIVVPKTENKKETYHTVAKGDTLYSIANAYKTTVDNLKKINGLKNDILSVGQKLKIK